MLISLLKGRREIFMCERLKFDVDAVKTLQHDLVKRTIVTIADMAA